MPQPGPKKALQKQVILGFCKNGHFDKDRYLICNFVQYSKINEDTQITS